MKKALVALLFLSSAFAQEKDRSRGPLIFLSGRGPVTASAGGVGVAVKGVAVASGSASYGGNDETMSIATDLVKKCPEVALTVSDDAKPDYILLVNRAPGGFLNGPSSQFMVLRPDKSILYANEKNSRMKAAKDACKAVLADWRTGRPSIAGSQQKQNNQPAPATDGWWKTETPAAQSSGAEMVAQKSPLYVPRSPGRAPVDVIRVEPHAHTRCGLAAVGTDDPDPWGTCLLIGYKNVSEQPISAIRFEVEFVNPLKEDSPAYFYEDAETVKPGKTWMTLWHDGVFWNQFGRDKMDAKVSVAKVMFADGTSWTPPQP